MDDVTPHIMVVEARFYEDLADEMALGAIAAIETAGATYERFSVPGAFEIPAAIRYALEADQPAEGRRKFDGFVALGCVIRGETTHYDYVCGESARALQDLAMNQLAAIGYGILTCENKDQAWARASRDKGNKGAAAVEACLSMVALRYRFELS
ncbi:6,7-dimethyl-8-ribityllumazine synthase [Sandarakinorhabdus sp.]|uniref:6,7-dimethyl-8-ribityllumazine synthase n=1 Tax=Sandarakinorhabdus sp. TaxID=1916663 RepID=UPI0035683883